MSWSRFMGVFISVVLGALLGVVTGTFAMFSVNISTASDTSEHTAKIIGHCVGGIMLMCIGGCLGMIHDDSEWETGALSRETWAC